MSNISSSSPISSVSLSQETGYPPLLRAIPDAPQTLWVQGNLSLLNAQCVAIVGTRHPTPRGVQMARYLSRKLTEEGYTIVAGLCEGIDVAAHEACLDAGGNTVAVLCGWRNIIGQFQPALKERILSQNGLLVAEHAPQVFHPKGVCGRELVRRDRIQSGLSLLVIPVQAGASSGTRHAVNAAKAQGRPIWLPYPDRRDAEAHPETYSGILSWIPRRGEESLFRGFNPLTEMDDLLWQLREERDSWLEQPGHSFVEGDPLLAFPEPQRSPMLGEVIETFS